MSEPNLRMTEPDEALGPAAIEAWVGKNVYGFWTRLTGFIDANYPGVFAPGGLICRPGAVSVRPP